MAVHCLSGPPRGRSADSMVGLYHSLPGVTIPVCKRKRGVYKIMETNNVNHNQKYSPAMRSALKLRPSQHQYYHQVKCQLGVTQVNHMTMAYWGRSCIICIRCIGVHTKPDSHQEDDENRLKGNKHGSKGCIGVFEPPD